MSHPLTELICDKFKSFTMREVDKTITTYLKGRAKWLKEKWVEQGNWHKAYTYDHIDTAFELDEKCEEFCECDDVERLGVSGGLPLIHKTCGKRIKSPADPKPTLPSHLPNAWQTGDMMKVSMYLSQVAIKVNDLIDYLLTKEAR